VKPLRLRIKLSVLWRIPYGYETSRASGIQQRPLRKKTRQANVTHFYFFLVIFFWYKNKLHCPAGTPLRSVACHVFFVHALCLMAAPLSFLALASILPAKAKKPNRCRIGGPAGHFGLRPFFLFCLRRSRWPCVVHCQLSWFLRKSKTHAIRQLLHMPCLRAIALPARHPCSSRCPARYRLSARLQPIPPPAGGSIHCSRPASHLAAESTPYR
jgi:hypothetical protein